MKSTLMDPVEVNHLKFIVAEQFLKSRRAGNTDSVESIDWVSLSFQIQQQWFEKYNQGY